MYLTKLTLRNIRSIGTLQWELPMGPFAGWHVIIGDNGAGKSSVLRAVALALVGPREAIALRQDWKEWLRWGEQSGAIGLIFDWDVDRDRFVEKGKLPTKHYLEAASPEETRTRRSSSIPTRSSRGTCPFLESPSHLRSVSNGSSCSSSRSSKKILKETCSSL